MANEKRLIDANALMESKWWDSLKDDFDKARVKIIVQSCPTVDAVEVVRCKDCKKWLKCEPSGTNCRVCADTTKIRLPYDFCSYGERRSDG